MSGFKTGTVEGTGAVIDVTVGFEPSSVQIFNVDGNCMLFWTKDMGQGKGFKTIAAGTTAAIASDGITVSSTSGFRGFSIGVDADVNVNAETLCWVAMM